MSGILAGNEDGSYTPPQLFAGDGAVRTLSGSFSTGQTLAANTVIARVKATGALVIWAPAASDGTEKAIGITCEAISTSGGAASHPYYISGDYNDAALTWPGSVTAAQKAYAFDGTPITTRTLG